MFWFCSITMKFQKLQPPWWYRNFWLVWTNIFKLISTNYFTHCWNHNVPHHTNAKLQLIFSKSQCARFSMSIVLFSFCYNHFNCQPSKFLSLKVQKVIVTFLLITPSSPDTSRPCTPTRTGHLHSILYINERPLTSDERQNINPPTESPIGSDTHKQHLSFFHLHFCRLLLSLLAPSDACHHRESDRGCMWADFTWCDYMHALMALCRTWRADETHADTRAHPALSQALTPRRPSLDGLKVGQGRLSRRAKRKIKSEMRVTLAAAQKSARGKQSMIRGRAGLRDE